LTVPVGAVDPDEGVTVAVSVSDAPCANLVEEADKAVVVDTGVVATDATTTGAEVEPLKSVLPLYLAVS
jgi:hypothetical protein